MVNKQEIVLLFLGVLIGVAIALVLIPPLQAESGQYGIIPGSPVQMNGPGSGDVLGAIPSFASKEEMHSFLKTHIQQQNVYPVTIPVQVTPVETNTGGTVTSVRPWAYEVDTTSFTPDEYIVQVSGITHTATASALFNIVAGPRPTITPVMVQPNVKAPAGAGYYVTITPVGDHFVGDKFFIMGTTNLPPGDEILVEVTSSSFKPTEKTQSGEFSGSTGTMKLSTGGGGGSGGGGGGGGIGPEGYPFPMPTSAVTAVPQISVPSDSQDRDYSKTNTQVKEVDEADIIKTDGNNIYVVSSNRLNIIQAYPAQSAKILSTLQFYGTPLSLYVNGDTLVLLCTEPGQKQYWRCTPGNCNAYPGMYNTKTIAFIYSVKNPADPVLVREIEIDGDYKDSRMIGSWLYFITTNAADPLDNNSDFPSVYDHDKGITTPSVYYFDTKDSSYLLTTVGAVDTGSDTPVRAKTFLIGSAGTVFASPTHLYIAISSQGAPDTLRHVDQNGKVTSKSGEITDIYSLALNNGQITYSATGTVSGTLLNQFSMDEYMGNLRVATTTNDWNRGGNNQYSNVYVLDQTMKTIGTLENIAPGERIYAARFMADKLYLVTFRETDPFFVIGLSDPTKPVILGKLKLPGYSTYLHPYDDTHIIGVGKESTSGGVKVALFNVADISNPLLVDSVVLGSYGSDTEVLRDHKAFLFDKEKNILVLPVNLNEVVPTQNTGGLFYPGMRSTWGGAYVFGVDPAKGFTLKGKVKHYDDRQGSYSPVKRSLYIENTLYTMSPAVIVMSDLTNNTRRINEVQLI
jgi:inhibitor of cysteine peptidase